MAADPETPPPNAIFDESGNFIIYPCLLGIKVRSSPAAIRSQNTQIQHLPVTGALYRSVNTICPFEEVTERADAIWPAEQEYKALCTAL